MAMRKGDDLTFKFWLEWKLNPNFPTELKTIADKRGHLTNKVINSCDPIRWNRLPAKKKVPKTAPIVIPFTMMFPYNEARQRVYIDELKYAGKEPFFNYIPDFIWYKGYQQIWVEIKTNVGYYGQHSIPAGAWNLKKQLIHGFCLKNKIDFLELRLYKGHWYDTTLYYGARYYDPRWIELNIDDYADYLKLDADVIN